MKMCRLFGRNVAKAERGVSWVFGCFDVFGCIKVVPKEHVYPKFNKITKLWLLLNESLEFVNSRVETFSLQDKLYGKFGV